MLSSILKGWEVNTCAVLSVSCEAGLACAGVVLFGAAAVGIFVAGKGERRAAHVYVGIQRNGKEIITAYGVVFFSSNSTV